MNSQATIAKIAEYESHINEAYLKFKGIRSSDHSAEALAFKIAVRELLSTVLRMK